ncbi:MAG TPA: beta-propeller fold lactonase family protein [Polyangiaceae bacterium]
MSDSQKVPTASAGAQVKTVPTTSNPYTLFETLQTRPLALSPDGRFLFACNTPDNRLEVFRVDGKTLHAIGSVVVGLEPVAVAARSAGEVWVVNHLSDSVSIVHVDDQGHPSVSQTLLVGDEPRDIVFAGPGGSRAFVTTAHRGQNGDDPGLHDPTQGRADVWVFDATNPGPGGGSRLTKITLFADSPRALAASADGSTVYAAAFFSGDQTTVVSEAAVAAEYPNGMPQVPYLVFGGQVDPMPTTGLIVKWKLGTDGNYHWLDFYGHVFDPYVRVSLPDYDVFAIDATANPPAAKANGVYPHVGTTLFNMATNPVTGKVYVSNTDAHNDVRFEGHTGGFSSVAGNIVDSRITVIDPASGALTVDNLNSHLNHAAGTGDPTLSRAFPQDMAVTHDGKSLWVVAQGSQKVAVYDTASLEAGTAAPTASNQVNLSAGGPTGVVLDESHGVAFVLTRFDDGISIVDTKHLTEMSHVQMFSPEPASVTAGRTFLYTANSALGDQSCASCHVGADFDGLAWDLGNPGFFPLPITSLAATEATIRTIPQAAIEALIGKQQADYIFGAYQPTKGPMTTQSLRGLDNDGAMHWRGDRNGAVQQTGAPFLDGMGNPVVSAQPNSGIFDEFNAFMSFNVAFPGLVGANAELSNDDMAAFTTFILQVSYPPNPNRALDNSLTGPQQFAAAFFDNKDPQTGIDIPVDRFQNCEGCHVLDRNGNAGSSPHPGFFGTDGRLSFENETQTFKVPHLRNAYQKVGMFGSSLDETHAAASMIPFLNPPVQAVRGFGYQHDGATGKLEDFFTAFAFIATNVPVTFGGIPNIPPNPGGIPLFDPNDPLNFNPANFSVAGYQLRYALADYVLAFDTNMFPIVGQEITLPPGSTSSSVLGRIGLLEAQAALGQCDLVVHGSFLGADHGATFSGGTWTTDVSVIPALTDAQLEALAAGAGSGLTFLAVPPGEGWRVGVDRDGDGYVDGDELAKGTDPDSAASHP